MTLRLKGEKEEACLLRIRYRRGRTVAVQGAQYYYLTLNQLYRGTSALDGAFTHLYQNQAPRSDNVIINADDGSEIGSLWRLWPAADPAAVHL